MYVVVNDGKALIFISLRLDHKKKNVINFCTITICIEFNKKMVESPLSDSEKLNDECTTQRTKTRSHHDRGWVNRHSITRLLLRGRYVDKSYPQSQHK